jgi:AcrR family transcriptional regulator
MNPRSRSAAAAQGSSVRSTAPALRGGAAGKGSAPALRGGAASAPRLRERLKQATRDAILDAAEAVFARDGVPGARMEDVAAAAGVAVGTLYNYFADRHALLEALLDARRAELLARVDSALESEGAAFERRLRAFFATMFEYFQQHLGLFALHMEAELVLRARKQRRGRPALSALLDRSARLMKEGVQSGALRGADADLYATVVMGMLRGVFMRHIYGIGPAPSPDAAARLARIFLRGAGYPSQDRAGATRRRSERR